LKQSMAGKYEEGFEYAIEQSEGLVPLHWYGDSWRDGQFKQN
jgi:hypothetical protein